MRILWFSHFVPYPPRGGHLQRSYHLIRQASRFAKVSLVAFNQLAEQEGVIAGYEHELRRICDEVHVWRPPVRWKGAGWWLRLLTNPHPRVPLAARTLWSQKLATRLHQMVSEGAYDIVHFDTLELAPYAPGCKGCRRVLNLHNHESGMMLRRAAGERSWLRRTIVQGEAEALRRMEEDYLAFFDAVITVCDADAGQVREVAPRAEACVVENGTDLDYFRPQGDGHEGEVVFAAAFNWYPNANAARELVTEIWPRIERAHPGARLTLAGKQPPSWLRKTVAEANGVSLLADPADIRPALARAAVVVCPIREGGGTRLKILDAMAMQKPVVATSIAVEGLRVRNGEEVVIEDGVEEFAQRVSDLLKDADARRRISLAARRRAECSYGWEQIGRQLLDAYRAAAQAKRGSRQFQFTDAEGA